jgi:hypothetical protein
LDDLQNHALFIMSGALLSLFVIPAAYRLMRDSRATACSTLTAHNKEETQ